MAGFPEDVEVGIVAHDAMEKLPGTLEALLDAGCSPGRIRVYDVASRDGLEAWIGRQHPRIEHVRLDRNEGPNPARNRALREARLPLLLLMDADVRVDAETVPRLRDRLSATSRVAIASPLVILDGSDGRIQYGGTWTHFICEAVNRWQGRGLDERGEEAAELGCASGNALLIRRDKVESVGGFDERMFMGKDDGDFTHRVVLAGYSIIEVPAARVIHVASPRGTGLIGYQVRNRWYFMLKNYEMRTFVLLAPALAIHELFQFLLLLAKGHAGDYFRAIPALVSLLPGLRAERRAVASIRRRSDVDLLQSDPLVVRGDFLDRPGLGRAKRLYDRWLRGYWSVVRGIIDR